MVEFSDVQQAIYWQVAVMRSSATVSVLSCSHQKAINSRDLKFQFTFTRIIYSLKILMLWKIEEEPNNEDKKKKKLNQEFMY